MSHNSTTVLVLGAGRWQAELIQCLVSMKLRVVAADISPDAYGSKFASAFIQADTGNRQTMLEIARRHQVALIFSDQSDRVVPIIAWLNQQLELPGIQPPVASLFTDKYLMRQQLLGCGLRMPRYRLVRTIGEAGDFARQHGFPIVLKPRRSWASMGVVKVNRISELADAFRVSRSAASSDGLLAEGYVDGTEVTVEGLTLDGCYRALATSDKQHYQHSPCVARSLSYPANLSPKVHDTLISAAREVSDQLALQDGLSHMEFRIQGDQPFLIEAAARGGGHGISSVLLPHLTGVNPARLLVRHLLGNRQSLPGPLRHRAATLQFLNFAPGEAKLIRGQDQVWREQLVHHLQLDFAAGQSIPSAADDRSRPGYFVTLGASREEVDRKSARVHELIRVIYVDPAATESDWHDAEDAA